MAETIPLLALYRLGERFAPEIAQHGGKLLKLVYEIDGRSITFNFDEREFPQPPEHRVPPPPPPPANFIAPPPPPPPPPVTDGPEALPLPPMPGDAPTFTAPVKASRTDPVDGIEPLTDNDLCPCGKAHTGKLMRDVPVDFLDWLYGQPWLRKKHPRLWAYIVRHEDVIAQDMKRTQRESR